MHASNPSNCSTDDMNVRLVLFSEGMKLGEGSKRSGRLAISVGLAVPISNLTWLQQRGGREGVFVCLRASTKIDNDYIIGSLTGTNLNYTKKRHHKYLQVKCGGAFTAAWCNHLAWAAKETNGINISLEGKQLFFKSQGKLLCCDYSLKLIMFLIKRMAGMCFILYFSFLRASWHKVALCTCFSLSDNLFFSNALLGHWKGCKTP